MNKIKPLDFVRVKKDLSKRKMTVISSKLEKGVFDLKFKDSQELVDETQYHMGLVTEVSDRGAASIIWIGSTGLHNAWWNPEDLEVVDNLPNVLTRELAHPMGGNGRKANTFFPVNSESVEVEEQMLFRGQFSQEIPYNVGDVMALNTDSDTIFVKVVDTNSNMKTREKMNISTVIK